MVAIFMSTQDKQLLVYEAKKILKNNALNNWKD